MEHIGRKFYKTFFKKIFNILTDDGLALCHTIGSVDPPGPVQPWIQRRIFPGGIVPSLSELVKPIEQTGLIIADTESLIHHYNLTLKAWRERFMANRHKAKYLYGEKFCKMWSFI